MTISIKLLLESRLFSNAKEKVRHKQEGSKNCCRIVSSCGVDNSDQYLLLMWLKFLCILLLGSLSRATIVKSEFETIEPDNFLRLEHPLNSELFSTLKKCGTEEKYCDLNFKIIAALCVKVANEHTALLLVDRAKRIFEDILYYTQSHTKIGQKAVQILAVLSFGQGSLQEVRDSMILAFIFYVLKSFFISLILSLATQAEQYWKLLNMTDLISQRTLAAQVLLTGSESDGIGSMLNYTTLLGERFYDLTLLNQTYPKKSKRKKNLINFDSFLVDTNSTATQSNNTNSLPLSDTTQTQFTPTFGSTHLDTNDHPYPDALIIPTSRVVRSPANQESEDALLALLMSEAQGGIRTNVKV
jgi:hypothetical protein